MFYYVIIFPIGRQTFNLSSSLSSTQGPEPKSIIGFPSRLTRRTHAENTSRSLSISTIGTVIASHGKRSVPCPVSLRVARNLIILRKTILIASPKRLVDTTETSIDRPRRQGARRSIIYHLLLASALEKRLTPLLLSA